MHYTTGSMRCCCAPACLTKFTGTATCGVFSFLPSFVLIVSIYHDVKVERDVINPAEWRWSKWYGSRSERCNDGKARLASGLCHVDKWGPQDRCKEWQAGGPHTPLCSAPIRRSGSMGGGRGGAGPPHLSIDLISSSSITLCPST